ncbi:AzlD domain-containing protein [Photobacterium lipolyticum]|uniref:Branched-chain amino acid ABC transporter n=1 Tax=Photobacterium lipolyticum TaxID=266810 RepID=A0A2T3MWM2_9GAMM|nr:AzlD domain-containing protein [Photobacterium lipolyticum]PSW04342.1 branched-chain amino acid ABC transporter [Photobacterium lipolyticum]
MIWLTILAMTLLVFASRYLFLEPKLPLRLNPQAQKLLSYSSPAVLTSIWAPIVFLPGGEPGFSFSNPYLIAATVAALVAWKLKNVLLTAVISMTVFFLLSYIPLFV